MEGKLKLMPNSSRMSAVLKLLFEGHITADTVILWVCDRPNEDTVKNIEDLSLFRQEFIPFFLNYLRNHTFHLLQSSRLSQSPAKTPRTQKEKEYQCIRAKAQNSKRLQLFSASPVEISEGINRLSQPVISSDFSTVNNSPESTNIRYGKSSSHHRAARTPSCNKFGGNNNNSDTQRSKQKFCLGEFVITPEKSNAHRKHHSPQAGRRKERADEKSNSISPLLIRGNKHKNFQVSPLSQPARPTDVNFSFDLPLGSLSDFPPVGAVDTKTDSADNNEIKSRSTGFIHRKENIQPSTSETQKLPDKFAIHGRNIRQNSKPSRRINPTPIQPGMERPRNLVFAAAQVSPTSFRTEERSVTDPSAVHINTERESLRIDKKKRESVDLADDINSPVFTTPTKSSLLSQTSSTEITIADRSAVTYHDKLDILIDLYSQCLMENLLPNLSVELYFLTQLLTVRRVDTEFSSDEDDEENYFQSLHNAVYFSTMVMEKLTRFLTVLDKSTLRLLSENPRVAIFSPRLKSQLTEAHQRNSAKTSDLPKSPIGSVSFQADTDNRENFPNDRAFHQFKKQRDSFYEMLREWEENNITPGWSLTVMSDKIQALVGYKTELANHLHFARLFQSQLLAMCSGDGSITIDGDDENIALLSQLKQSNPEKWKKLQERFIKPLSCGGPCPTPSFPGCQEFFRDFIVVASSPHFNQHLADTFAAKVTELNSISFSSEGNGDMGNEDTHEEWKELFSSNLLTLRLLGKFLGFVTFLPYRTVEKLPDSMRASYLVIRNKLYPCLDILKCLQTALTVDRLTLTIPWVVEFISLMDYMAPELDYFKLVLLLMLHIHRLVWARMRQKMCFGYLLIVTMLSWIFENPALPEGFFFSEISEAVLQGEDKSSQNVFPLDKLNLVDQHMYYICCPYIGEVRTLLVEFAVGFSIKANNIRKITPTAADHLVSTPLNKKPIQNQLEENFFHNHPASLRRCVEFVAERTASNYIKNFRSKQLQQSIEDCKRRVGEYIRQLQGSSPTKTKDKVMQEIYKISQVICITTKMATIEGIEQYCHPRTEAILKLLLPDEKQEAVVCMAARICNRMTEDRVVQWIKKHIIPSMYHSELEAELEKLMRELPLSMEPSDIPEVLTSHSQLLTIAKTHSMDMCGPSDTLVLLKELLRDLLIDSRPVNIGQINCVLDMVWETINNRQDLLQVMLKTILQVSLDMAVAIISRQPTQFTYVLLEQFLQQWRIMKEHSGSEPFSSLLSARVLLQIQESKETQLSWEKFMALLLCLMDNQLLTPSSLCSTCIKTLPHMQTDKKLLTQLTTCLQNIQQSRKGFFTDGLSELQEWITTFCGLEDQSIT